ncbi:hypothetical protein DBB29_00845 [Pandoraea cepalis]|uniref:Type II secretion system protein GspF domain-containing protein n=1 Tax=Pandoraea cepalis TaxID=2508294 RepID=A0AAW7MH60_9BURK|nr:type II secretion system F family protein [Pandoraea cepalis]MDN4572030.1 hypothetical protein [Pandoraea cepalis]MDN4576681.1 hypothetical protein [Pandoraea cepalis]
MYESISNWWWQKRFSDELRAEFYSLLAMQLRSDVKIQPACETIASNYEYKGEGDSFFLGLIERLLPIKRLFPNTLHMVASECTVGISGGRSFYETLAPWIPYDELATIRAGASAGATTTKEDAVALALDRAEQIVEQKRKMRDEISDALMDPVGNLLLSVGSLYAMVTWILPKLLTSLSRPGQVHIPTTSESIARFIAEYGVFLGVGAVVLIAAIAFSLPRLTGDVRVYLDRLMPWSMYRQIQGAVLFYNIGALMASGIQKSDVLELLRRNATPYIRERIDGMMKGVAAGKTLGDALELSGYEFPSVHAIGYIRVVSQSKNGDDNLQQLGIDWLAKTVKDVRRVAKNVRTVSYAVLAGNVFLIASLINDLSNGVINVLGKM